MVRRLILTIFIVVMFMSFIAIDKVSAYSIDNTRQEPESIIDFRTDNFNLLKESYYKMTDTYIENLKKIITYLDNNVSDFDYIIFREDGTTTQQVPNFRFVFYPKSANAIAKFNSTYTSSSAYSSIITYFESQTTFNYYQLEMNMYDSGASDMNSIRLYGIGLNRNTYSTTLGQLSSTMVQKLNVTNSGYDVYKRYSSTSNPYLDTNFCYNSRSSGVNSTSTNGKLRLPWNLYLYSSQDIKLKDSLDQVNFNIFTDVKTYKVGSGDVFPSLINIINQKYNFRETINGLTIGKVEINFKIPTDLNYRDTYQFNLKVNSLSMLENAYSPMPYLKYGNIFKNDLITQVDLFTDYEEFQDSETLRTYTNYTGNFGIDMNYNDNSDFISLTLDFGDYVNNYLLSFESNLEYEIKYISREEEQNYYTSIDMTNKYALYLIPKVLNTDIYSTISLAGTYDLYFIKNINDKNSESVYKGKQVDTSFINKYNFQDVNSALRFTNKNSNVAYQKITFDNRLFSYTIQESAGQNVEIYNPNTNENVNSNIVDSVITDYEIEQASKDKTSSIFMAPINAVRNKFPILEQAINIYNLYSSYDYQETKPNFPKISLSFMGIDKEFETIDLSFYEQYRDLIFSYSKLTMALLTLLKVVKNVKNSFGGGN